MNNQAKLFRAVTSITIFEDNIIEQAKDCFHDYVDKGIILTSNFANHKWKTTNEYANISFIFNVNQFQYKRFYEPLFNINYEQFIDYLKAFIVLSMDQHVLVSLQNFLRDIKRIIKETKQHAIMDVSSIKMTSPTLCLDFLASLPNTNNDDLGQLLEQLDNVMTINYELKPKQQRQLAQFQSYFLFNDILTDYWAGAISDEERLFYYPLYLWWHITAIIPLRPREFLLTQRDCLSEKKGKYYLTLRRNNLKGKEKAVTHKISEDYYQTTYEIPQKLALSIQTYLNLTEAFASTQLDTLFVTDPHYRRWERQTGINNRFLTYTNLNTILKHFFNEVISQQLGYHVYHIEAPHRLEENEINFIRIGDTRHIAMINLIAEGSNPVTAMLLAGHDNITTSSHYFSNLSQFIECRSYQVYRKLMSSQTSYEISKCQPQYTIGKAFVTLDNKGRCYSPKFATGDFSDCLNVISSHAELGACTSCPFYRKPGKDFFSMDSAFKKGIEEEALVVDQAIKRVRLNKGHVEEIGEALLKLKTVSHSYQDYLTAKQLTRIGGEQ